MPTYEYVCPLCGFKRIEVRSIHEEAKQHLCKNCNIEMHQLLGNIGLTFKGGGWAQKE